MNTINYRALRINNRFRFLALIALVVGFVCSGAFVSAPMVEAQSALSQTPGYRIGERLTYRISIGRVTDAAYAELQTVSRGRIGDKDAVELRAKFKTLDLASATKFLIDESRTTFAAPSTGLPLSMSIIKNMFGLPKEKSYSFLTVPAAHADLLTMIQKIRQSGGTGSLTLQDNEKVYPVSYTAGLTERIKTDAGEYETRIVTVISDFFTDNGMTAVSVYLSNDDARLPVLVRFKTEKGTVTASLANAQVNEPVAGVQQAAIPIPIPLPERTPKPVVTPTPYIDDLPLAQELALVIGEQLEYRILSAGKPVAKMRLLVRERRLVNGLDSLLLEAMFSDAVAGSPFANGDFARVHVDPETLSPRQVEMRFGGVLRNLSNTVKFEKQGSVITIADGTRVDAPVGTHSILSLIYAARSFNLKPSLDLNNPINDTRVAVFWEKQHYVFTLRPSISEVITVDETPLAAQLVSVSTKNPVLDALNIKVWLGNDVSRMPLRFIVGSFQADLITKKSIQP